MNRIFGVALLGLPLLAGCGGGNPDNQAYANEPGGTIAVAPTPLGAPTYDPYAKAAPFADMRIGGVGANQPATPPPPVP